LTKSQFKCKQIVRSHHFIGESKYDYHLKVITFYQVNTKSLLKNLTIHLQKNPWFYRDNSCVFFFEPNGLSNE